MIDLDLRTVSMRDLLSLFGGLMDELRRREVVRSSNNPVADYAEFLVARALRLKLLRSSNTGCDAVDSNGKRYEVKGRRVTKHNPSTQLSVIRQLDSCHFDFLAGVLFDEDFSILRACLVPHEAVRRMATYSKHQNGWILHLRSSLWEQDGVREITQGIRDAQSSGIP
jgi:hypothetical protein